MRLEEIRFTQLLHGAAGLLLAAAFTLLGYELKKPPLVQAAPAAAALKPSALAAPQNASEQWNRLPELPLRYQKKVIYAWGVRKSFPASKTYLAQSTQAN